MSAKYGVVPVESVTEWDDEADVVVVGMGAAGCASSITAQNSRSSA